MLLKALISFFLGMVVAFAIQATMFLQLSQAWVQADIDATNWSEQTTA